MNSVANFKGFYKQIPTKRQQILQNYARLTEEEVATLQGGLTTEQADLMIENAVGQFSIPLGLATNFLINGREVIVPMAVEEPSIVAGVSYAAKLAHSSSGFFTYSTEPLMIGQIQLLEVADIEETINKLQAIEPQMLEAANQFHPTIQAMGGGAKRFEYRPFPDTPVGPMLVIHLLYDCRDAMGANAVNTAVEAIAPLVKEVSGGRVNLRILSNLTDQRMATAECMIRADYLAREDYSGKEVAQRIYEAWAFATVDPYRAATHNKGIMNGVDAVAVATGNDWRALEAGAHAYAARNGHYTSLTTWSLTKAQVMNASETKFVEKLHLKGVLEMPLSVGTVGGATKAHPAARTALKIMGEPDARDLAEIMVAVGLAQNFAALRALATEGIQQGHMRLHARKQSLEQESE